MSNIFQTGVVCKACRSKIWSKHRHDYHACSCGKTFVDGGQDYLRFGCEEGVGIPERYHQPIYFDITKRCYVAADDNDDIDRGE